MLRSALSSLDAWCVVRGAWFVVRGSWCVVRGAWCVVRGAWFVVRGAWCVVRGAWCVVRGAWVWMCRSGARDFCTLQKGKQHRFLCFLLFLSLYFNFFRALSYMYVFLFPQGVPLDLEVGYEKSVLTRTEILSG